ncbi:MAG TPA: DUF6249 domain-containing protein [Cytophagaceae bacterium]|jgi:hypothetical protein
MNKGIIAAICIFGLAPLLISTFLIFAFISGNKERMAMIEKGISPVPEQKDRQKKKDIKGAFFLAGVVIRS